jgi:hypothetical protein
MLIEVKCMQRHGQMRIHDTDTDTDQKEGRQDTRESHLSQPSRNMHKSGT